ncbi:uncharacterized protein [Clytia hemisphaerica]|uniref:RecA family profile 1 domain-containing protein n=1 Tax=Clytia hemisphaerica TaxID=252671 RepID=A0A7M5UD52_9CNID
MNDCKTEDSKDEQIKITTASKLFRDLSNSKTFDRKEIPLTALSELVSKHGCQLIQGAELWEETLNFSKIISTGTKKVDLLLDGGLYTGEMIEIFGPPSCGKTQFAFNVVANVLLSKAMNVLVYDSCGSFSAKRINELASFKNPELSPTQSRELFSKLSCVKVFDIFCLLTHLEQLKEKLSSGIDQFTTRLKFIIVDSITLLISPILGGKQTQGHGLMARLSILLKELAYENNIAVLVVNGTVTAKTGEYFNNKFKPALGKHWLSAPHVRLFMEFASTKDLTLRKLTIHKHHRLPILKNNASFYISKLGLQDDTS